MGGSESKPLWPVAHQIPFEEFWLQYLLHLEQQAPNPSPELNVFTFACAEKTLNFTAHGRLVNDVHGVFAPLRWHTELNALLLSAFKLASVSGLVAGDGVARHEAGSC